MQLTEYNIGLVRHGRMDEAFTAQETNPSPHSYQSFSVKVSYLANKLGHDLEAV